jgi:hypothetical protein
VPRRGAPRAAVGRDPFDVLHKLRRCASYI